MTSKLIGATLILINALLPGQSADADGLLDRLKRKADGASREARDLRDDVEAATDVEARVESTVDRAIPSETQIEHRAAASIESTAAVQAVRQVESDADDVATADERAHAAVTGERNSLESEVDRATDVEGRARNEVGRTEAARTVRETQRDVHSVTTIDDRAEREVQRQRDSLERVLEE
jgi:hypothetical protein